MRRPASALVVRKKPAKRGETGLPVEDPPNSIINFVDIDPRELIRQGPIVLQEALYYGRTAPIAGHVKSLFTEGDQFYARMKVSGTKHEELLRVLSGRRDREVKIHLCDAHCTGQLTDEVLVHASKFEKVDLEKLPWLTNLRAVGPLEEEPDDLRPLREEQRRMEEEFQEKEKKEKKLKKKRKKREAEAEDGRPTKSPKRPMEDLEVGQKALEEVFRDTGMDPNPERRMKILKKARRIGKRDKKKKKKKERESSSAGDSSSSSTSSSSSADYGEAGLFTEEMRLRAIWKKCPGALTARSIQEIKKNLLTSAGTVWEVNKASLPPIYTQYGRQSVMPGMSASLQQESLTLCQCLDLLAQGKVASSMDVLNQRLKSLEALGRGAHWTLCRQYELVKVDDGGMAEEQEKLAAARRAKEEERLRSLMSRPQSGKGTENALGGKTRKGKEGKGANKGQSGDGSKGKGGSAGKEDSRGSWQKKTEK